MKQKYKSAETSVNSSKLPAIVHIWDDHIISGLSILDYGCGKFRNTERFLTAKGFRYFGYDPFNVETIVNRLVLAKQDYHYAILSNVLNVIAERDVRHEILWDVKKHLGEDGTLYIKIYEGNKSGVMKVNEKKNSCQLNRKTSDYMPEVEAVFGEENVKERWVNGIHVIEATKKVK